jgi:hypothetical protein
MSTPDMTFTKHIWCQRNVGDKAAWNSDRNTETSDDGRSAFSANIDADIEWLKMGGSIGPYATDNATPKIPFWLMVFKNLRLYFLGSDDCSAAEC